MEKMNCDIIKDLIPSYVDEVCSKATKECVEAHLEECGECRLVAARLRNNALSGEKLEQKGLDGLKKIKRNLDFHRVVNYGILLLLVFYGIELFIAKHTGYVIFNRPGYWKPSVSSSSLSPGWDTGSSSLRAGGLICAVRRPSLCPFTLSCFSSIFRCT